MGHVTGACALSIIVPIFNQAALTVRCFESIKRNTSLTYELIWIDNGSQPAQFNEIYHAIKRLDIPTKLVRFKRNMGFIKATNAGILEASGDHVILLNNDTEVGHRWDVKLIKPLADSAVGAVGPVTQSKIAWQEISHVNRKFNLQLPGFQGTIESYSKLLDQRFSDKYIEVAATPLAFFCTALRKQTFGEVGLLDERFGLGLADDDDFCGRLRAAGKRLMLSVGTFVYHHHRTTFRAAGVNVDALLRTNLKLLREKRDQSGLCG